MSLEYATGWLYSLRRAFWPPKFIFLTSNVNYILTCLANLLEEFSRIIYVKLLGQCLAYCLQNVTSPDCPLPALQSQMSWLRMRRRSRWHCGILPWSHLRVCPPASGWRDGLLSSSRDLTSLGPWFWAGCPLFSAASQDLLVFPTLESRSSGLNLASFLSSHMSPCFHMSSPS